MPRNPSGPSSMPPASATGGSTSAGAVTAAGDDWASLAAAATRTVDALEDRAQNLRRLTQRIVAPKDASRAKQALRESHEADGDLVSGARETLRRLEARVQAVPANAAVSAALGKAAVMALESFEGAQMALVRRVQEVEGAAGVSSGGSGAGGASGSRRNRGSAGARRSHHYSTNAAGANATGDADEDDEEGTALVDRSRDSQQHQQQQQRQEAFQVDVYDDIMRERSREVAEIAENIRDIHEIFQHISVMVAEQGEGIAAIEGNVDTTADEVTRGRIELERARQQQRDNSSVRCYVIALFFIIGLLFLVAVLYR